MTILSAVTKDAKRGKKRKRHKDDSSDDSNSDWHGPAEHIGNIYVEQTTGDLSSNQGSGNGHLFTLNNNLSNDDKCTHVANYSSNVDYLTNNLFVYNEKSYPAHLRKNVREKYIFHLRSWVFSYLMQMNPIVTKEIAPTIKQSCKSYWILVCQQTPYVHVMLKTILKRR